MTIKKSVINFIIDALMFICMSAIAGIGFLIKYVLVPGSKRWEIYERNVDLTFLGIDRHEWGEIHLIIGFVLIGLLALHIILHWNMVFCIYCNIVKKKSPRRILAIVFIILCIILAIVPLFLKPEIHEIENGTGRSHESHKVESYEMSKINELTNESKSIDHHTNSSINIQGFMSLKEVSDKYNVPTAIIKEKLGIQQNESDNQKLGWLRKEYNFRMTDIESIIEEYQIKQGKTE